MNFDGASPVVISLAKEFIAAMRRINPLWERAYWRFVCADAQYGSNASYSTSSGVTLISTLNEGQLFDNLNDLGRQLWNFESDLSRKFCVCLLVVSSDFDYEIKFEQHDQNKWRITKLDGKSGIPEGL
ncbi:MULTISPECIES: hypothetical protein [unclassified Duganella]|uniref:hypothetical protein n=1 Tax=unclassified Duganella TaxID=2636909 RepID=UPI0010294E9C|nr:MULTISPECIES: hypothetical protein [unclassified Duganella]